MILKKYTRNKAKKMKMMFKLEIIQRIEGKIIHLTTTKTKY
jgi:hypothetical protein